MNRMRLPRTPETEDAMTLTMTRRAMTGFGLLATLAVGSLALFWLQTRAIESSARVLNVSGRQRMLSQRTALLSDALVRSRSVEGREQIRSELGELARMMKAAHHGLVQGSTELQLPTSVPPDVITIYFGPVHGLDQQVKHYLHAVEELVETPDPADWNPSFIYVEHTAAAGRLLGSLDAVVSAFQAHEEAQISRLQRAKLIVFLLTLVVIVLMRRGVVQPMVDRVRRYIRELHRHHERLAHVARLSTMGEMTAGIAHEINQPLSAIMTYAQACRRLIDAGQAGTREHAEALEKIRSQAERAGEVIRRVRSLVERRDTERELAELNPVVVDTVKLAEADVHFKSSHVVLDLTEKLPPVMIDTVQIQQVVLNLVRNALEAVVAAGSEAPVTVRTAPHGPGEVKVSVEDQGAGVAEGADEKLFEPFFTTKDSGMGMGLSISRTIIDAHGGRLGFDRRPEGGSTFYFTIPASSSGGDNT